MEGWGFELTSTFKLKLDIENCFLKMKIKVFLIKYLLPAYFYIQVLFSYLLDEEKCHS